MFVIECPWCGARDQSEFSYGGEAHISRPENSAEMSDAEWAEFVFMRSNPKGVLAERWNHAHGCQRWFNAIRNSVTDEILATYAHAETPPDVDASRSDRAGAEMTPPGAAGRTSTEGEAP